MLRLLRTSIVFRSAFTVLGVALLVGTVFAAFAFSWSYNTSQKHTKTRMLGLVNTVENTTSVACYLVDRHLATEVSMGLLKNEDVQRVRIFAGATVLADLSKIGSTIIDTSDKPISPAINILRDVISPLNSDQPVCQIMLEPNTEFISEDARSKARFFIYLLIMQAVVMAAAVVYVVSHNITRPIKNISDSLHRLSATTGARLALPWRNKDDEIGQLVQDVNTLVADIVRILNDERKLRMEHAIGEKKFKAIFENSETGIFLISAAGELMSHNQAFLRLIGARTDTPLSEANNAFSEALEGQELRLHLMIDAANKDARVEAEDFCIDVGLKEKRWLNIVISAVEDDVLQGLVNDITERKQGEEEARQLAVTDHLTGAFNRLGFDREMARLTKDASKGKRVDVFLLLIDLDHFKAVNDAYGHGAGDKVLRHFYNVLTRTLRRSDFIARLGGDEFVAILKDVSQAEKAEDIANKIIEQLRVPITVSVGTHVNVGASIGISFSSSQSFDKDTLLRQADEAMYDVKNHGKMGYRLYRPS